MFAVCRKGKIMRVYISGGITGVPNYKENFSKAESYLKLQGYEVINPCMVVLPESCTWEDYMKIDFNLLSLCDSVYMLKDWGKSSGAFLEIAYAKMKNLKIMYEEARNL
jgi:hypothetical protein